jgi:C_GCAxxG_C_C family probable redox protein
MSDEIEQAKRQAHASEKNFGGCAQSVLGALQEQFGIGNVESFKAASALAGGVARQGETCGAVIGALSALGLVIGRDRIEDVARSRSAMEAAVQLRNRFKEEMNAQFAFRVPMQNTLCRHIHELVFGRAFDLGNKDEYQAFLDAGGHGDTGCPKVCAVAAQVAAEEISRLRQARP